MKDAESAPETSCISRTSYTVGSVEGNVFNNELTIAKDN
jgi:hypothetical protein